MSPIQFPNMRACVTDSRRALLDSDAGPGDPTDFAKLLRDLERARTKLPRPYRRFVVRRYLTELRDLGQSEFETVLRDDPEGEGSLILDIAQAILQRGEGYQKRATAAFQEVVADLYDGFLSAEDRAGVKPPDRGVLAPLVKWGNPDWGPYTWPADDTAEYGSAAAVVNLPPSHASGCPMAWSALGHETGGHDILHADDGLLLELKGKVRMALEAAKLPGDLADYWSDRIDETGSDVLGILNMGPAAGAGMIAYFRGFSAGMKLGATGSGNDEHPADVLRGWLAAATVRLLSFKDRDPWADALVAETNADAGTRPIRLAGQVVTRAVAQRSAAVVAETLVKSPIQSLEGRALGMIQDWRDRDERNVARLRACMRSDEKARKYRRVKGHYAAHVVAAAVYEALRVEGAEPTPIFRRMLTVLKSMHNANPAWGPQFLSRAKAIGRHVVHARS